MKEFYFIRHGQTDHNLKDHLRHSDHPVDISLNETGKKQAKKAELHISKLSIKTICSSPLKRAQETKQIVSLRLQADHHDFDDFGECNIQIWRAMAERGMYSAIPSEGEVKAFMDRVGRGLEKALQLPGPLLIVAHGGVHWAICCLFQIEEHPWAIDNCTFVHFKEEQKKWKAVLQPGLENHTSRKTKLL